MLLRIRQVTCHLGNGSSLSAVKDGKCMDTSMGLSPLAGVPMGTRSGDIDACVVQFICNKYGMSVDDCLNTRPGPRARARGGEAEEGAAPRGREAPPGAPLPSPSRTPPPDAPRRTAVPLDRPRGPRRGRGRGRGHTAARPRRGGARGGKRARGRWHGPPPPPPAPPRPAARPERQTLVSRADFQ